MENFNVENQKEKLFTSLQELFSEKTPFVTADYVEKLKDMCNLFIKLYVESQLKGQDELAPVKYVNEGKRYRSTMGHYQPTEKKLIVYLDPIAEMTTLKENFEATGKKIEELTEKEDSELKHEISMFYIIRNKNILQLLNTVAHEYRHFFQDKYMAFCYATRDDEMYEWFGEERKKRRVLAEGIEESWRQGGNLKNKENIYKSIVNPIDKNPAQKLREAFEHEEHYQFLHFTDVLGILENLNDEELDKLSDEIEDCIYTLELHERDARRGAIETLFKFKNDILDFATKQNDGKKKDIAIEIFEKINYSITTDVYEVTNAKKKLAEFTEKMTNCTIEDFVKYGEGLEKRKNEDYFSPFLDVVTMLKKCSYTQHLFTPENRKKMYFMFKEKGLDEYANIIGDMKQEFFNKDEIDPIE